MHTIDKSTAFVNIGINLLVFCFKSTLFVPVKKKKAVLFILQVVIVTVKAAAFIELFNGPCCSFCAT